MMQCEPYLQIPKNIYFGISQLEMTYVQKEVLRYIAGKVYEWPETRDSKQVECSVRYIQKAISIAYQHVAEALGELEKAGYIIWEKSETKGIGSLITLIPEKIKSVTCAVTDSINSVTKAVTDAAGSVTSAVTNKRTFFKKEQQTAKAGAAVSYENLNTDKNINPKKNSQSKTDKIQNNQSNNKNSALSEEISENLLPPAPAGVVQKVLRDGAKDLRNRGISDIVAAINRIKEEMANRTDIKNANGYFRQLCRIMDVTAPLSVGKVKNEAQRDVPGKIQEENERKWQQWEAERRQEEQEKAQKEAQRESQIKKQEDEIQEEKKIDFVAGLAALKVASPVEVREIERLLKKEYGYAIWAFTPNKAEIIVRKFYEKYGMAL